MPKAVENSQPFFCRDGHETLVGVDSKFWAVASTPIPCTSAMIFSGQ